MVSFRVAIYVSLGAIAGALTLHQCSGRRLRIYPEQLVQDVCQRIQRQTGWPRTVSIAATAFAVSMVMSGRTSEAMCNLTGFIYPAYASFSALLSRIDQFSASAGATTEAQWLHSYQVAKTVFLLWCFLPQTRGSQVIFMRAIRPYLSGSSHIDSVHATGSSSPPQLTGPAPLALTASASASGAATALASITASPASTAAASFDTSTSLKSAGRAVEAAAAPLVADTSLSFTPPGPFPVVVSVPATTAAGTEAATTEAAALDLHPQRTVVPRGVAASSRRRRSRDRSGGGRAAFLSVAQPRGPPPSAPSLQ